MLEIPLSRGLIALVDDDCQWLLTWKWHASGRSKKSNLVYAQRTEHITRTDRRLIYMHRVLCPAADGLDVDHIDGNGLNNQRSNLRAIPHALNIAKANRPIGPSGYRGVHFSKHRHKWTAQIRGGKAGQVVNLGVFATAFDAAIAWDKAAFATFGDFARLNFPERADEYRVALSEVGRVSLNIMEVA